MLTRQLRFSAALAAVLFASSAQAGYVGWPCSGTVTSPYGPRSSPCSGCSTFHYGIDIGVGTYLGAPAAGSFVSYVWSSCGGNIYTLGYGGGWQTRFLHTSAALDTSGGVADNQDVARSGGTGSCTTGPHLHFEVRKDGVAQSIPGADNSWVTRNANVPKDYPGLNNPPPPGFNVIIDNASAYFGASANWSTGTSSADKYGGDYRWRATQAISDKAGWVFNLPSGNKTIQAWWAAGTNRSTAAPYILPGVGTVTKNQQGSGGMWNTLGTVSATGTQWIELSCWATSGYVVVADAIRAFQ
jgi:Peptidase family M23